MLPHAPGVQMQAIPGDAVPDDTVDEDTEGPDKRLSSKTFIRFHKASASMAYVAFLVIASLASLFLLSSTIIF